MINLFRSSLTILLSVLGVALLILFLVMVAWNNYFVICTDKNKLTELMGVGFESSEILEVQCGTPNLEGTKVLVILRENEELETKEWYFPKDGSGISDANLMRIPPEHIEELHKINVIKEDIRRHGTLFLERHVVCQTRPYSVDWYEIADKCSDSNVIVLVAYVPCMVILEASDIIGEEVNSCTDP